MITHLADLRVDEVAASVVDVVSAEKATWTRLNLIAEAERQLRPLRFATPCDREVATRLVLDRALHPDHAVQLTPDGRENDLPEVCEVVARR